MFASLCQSVNQSNYGNSGIQCGASLIIGQSLEPNAGKKALDWATIEGK